MEKKRAYERTEKRQAETIEAVIELCGSSNPSTLTTSDIAKGINLSQGALFKHFPNKGNLWEAVAKWMAKQMIDKVFRVSEQYQSPIRALEAMFLAHISFISKKPGVPKLMLGELQKPDKVGARVIIDHVLNDYRDRVILLLREGVLKNEIRNDIDIEAAAISYLGSVQGLIIQSLILNDMAMAKDYAARVFEIFKAGIEVSR
ncbi:TetR/AcrR family transcriptional regulator [Marinobacter maritimus]|uniref:TetR/AcrR family transcriptional regulator n=1 Tax=Marinobacter maritimus TaxID=277961 RepID=UPI0011A1C2CB|nr:TetR/AcrR family transcriptional regulator [Marinobacter maritimus]